MSSLCISTTRRGSFNALRFQGILATESYAQIVSMLEKSLSKEHALLFAEPVHQATGEYTDWYAAREGTATPLLQLPEEEQQAVKKRIAMLGADIKDLADRLKADPGQARQIRGNVLAQAMICPGLEYIYVVDGNPVLTCWGYEPGGFGALPEDVMRRGEARTTAQATSGTASVSAGSAPLHAATPAPGRHAFPGWLRILILLPIILLVLYLLLCLLFGPSGCASPGILPSGCCVGMSENPTDTPPVPPANGTSLPAASPQENDDTPSPNPKLGNELNAELEKQRELQRRLEQLRTRLVDRMAECARPPARPQAVAPIPETPAPAEPPIGEQPPETPSPNLNAEADEPPSLEDLMPLSPEPPAEPTPKPKPKPGNSAHAPGEEMRIPKDAGKNKDLSFLKGCWTSETGLMSTRGEPVNVQYCFDASGKGKHVITETRTNTRCTGSATARIDSSGKLTIKAQPAKCNKQGTYVGQAVQCTPDASGKAQCYGQNNQGKKWKATFRKQ